MRKGEKKRGRPASYEEREPMPSVVLTHPARLATKRNMKKLTRAQVLQLAAEAQVDPRTVASIYAGKDSKAIVRERVVAAAKKLKTVLPCRV